MLPKLKATSKSKAKAKPKANSSEEEPDTNIEPEEPDGPGAEPEGEVEVKKKPAAKPRKGALKRPAAAQLPPWRQLLQDLGLVLQFNFLQSYNQIVMRESSPTKISQWLASHLGFSFHTVKYDWLQDD